MLSKTRVYSVLRPSGMRVTTFLFFYLCLYCIYEINGCQPLQIGILDIQFLSWPKQADLYATRNRAGAALLHHAADRCRARATRWQRNVQNCPCRNGSGTGLRKPQSESTNASGERGSRTLAAVAGVLRQGIKLLRRRDADRSPSMDAKVASPTRRRAVTIKNRHRVGHTGLDPASTGFGRAHRTGAATPSVLKSIPSMTAFVTHSLRRRFAHLWLAYAFKTAI